MNHELNDGVVAVVNLLVNICHGIALAAVLLLNYVGFQFTQNWDGFWMVVSHILGTAVVIVVYALFMGVISIFISINRNLQRLVALQSGESETPSPVFHFNPRDVVTVVFILSIIGIIGYVAYLLLTGQFNATTD